MQRGGLFFRFAAITGFARVIIAPAKRASPVICHSFSSFHFAALAACLAAVLASRAYLQSFSNTYGPASRLAQYRVDQVQRRGGQVVPHELGNVFCADMYFVYQLTFEGYRAIVATASAAQIGHLLVKCLAD